MKETLRRRCLLKKSLFIDLYSDAEPLAEMRASSLKIPTTDPEYGEWMKAHPEYMLAMIHMAHELFDEKYPLATPEAQGVMKEATSAFLNEMASSYVDATYNGIVDRVNRIDPTYLLDEKDLAEIKACSQAMDQLVDVALDILEPERTRCLTHMIVFRDYLRKILSVQ